MASNATIEIALSIVAIIVPVSYSIFFEGDMVIGRRKNNFIIEIMNVVNDHTNWKFYLIFSLSAAIPILLMSWFDYLHLDSSLADFYLPSIAVIITGLLITIFKRLWVLFISSIGVFLLFKTFYIFHQYVYTLYVLYALSLLIYISYIVFSTRSPEKGKNIRNFQWVVEVAAFSVFTFQLIYSIFVITIDSLPIGNQDNSNLLLGNLYIVFILGWSVLLALSLAFGLRWIWTSARINIFYSTTIFKLEKVEISVKNSLESKVISGSVQGMNHAFLISEGNGKVTLIPWEEIQMISVISMKNERKKGKKMDKNNR